MSVAFARCLQSTLLRSFARPCHQAFLRAGAALPPQHSHFAWIQLISKHAKCGQGAEALRVYGEMREEGMIPEKGAILFALKACSSIPNLEAGKEIHSHVAESMHRADMFVASALVDMYAKCSCIEEARRIFDKTRHRDVVCWNAMIIGYAQMEMGSSALELYARMRREGLQPDDRTFVAVLKACGSLATQGEGEKVEGGLVNIRALEQGTAFHIELAKRGLESNIFVANTLVDMYAKCGRIEESWKVFERMVHRDVVSWNAIIMGYAQMEMGEIALKLYARMQCEGFTPNNRTFIAALKACGSLLAQDDGRNGGFLKMGCLEQVRAIHAQVTKSEFESNIFVANTLVDMYAKCGSMMDAYLIFKKMRYRDVVTWTAMISGYTQVEKGELALELYEHMQHEGCTPDALTFVAALKACGCLASQEESSGPNSELKIWCLEQGRAIHAQVRQRRLDSDLFISCTLIDVYAKCGSIVDAQQVFERMQYRNIISFTAMIMGYVQMEMGDCALKLYARMQRDGYMPDIATFIAVLKACGNVASLEIGKEIHAQINNSGLEGDIFLASCVIDMYGKCGSMVDAHQLFDSLPARDSVIWSALIAGYSGQGDSEHVFDMYEKMQQEGVKPVAITFVSILTVCTHNGLVDKGQMFFHAMCLEHGISPSSKNYMCMVALLGKAGQVDEAVSLVKKMPFKPDIVTWTTILAACRMWNHVGIGRIAFDCAMNLDKDCAAAYALMTT